VWLLVYVAIALYVTGTLVLSSEDTAEALYYEVQPFKTEAQTALFKDPVRTAL